MDVSPNKIQHAIAIRIGPRIATTATFGIFLFTRCRVGLTKKAEPRLIKDFMKKKSEANKRNRPTAVALRRLVRCHGRITHKSIHPWVCKSLNAISRIVYAILDHLLDKVINVINTILALWECKQI